MRPLPRRLLLATAVAAPLLAATPAAAQLFDAGTPTATQLGDADLFIGVQHQQGANLSDFDRARFFNKAHCDCNEIVYVYIALTDSGFAKRTLVDQSGNIEFFVGSQCDSNDSGRPLRCKSLKAEPLAAFLVAGRDTVQTTARVLSTFTQST